jgi:hypothetical protein
MYFNVNGPATIRERGFMFLEALFFNVCFVLYSAMHALGFIGLLFRDGTSWVPQDLSAFLGGAVVGLTAAVWLVGEGAGRFELKAGPTGVQSSLAPNEPELATGLDRPRSAARSRRRVQARRSTPLRQSTVNRNGGSRSMLTPATLGISEAESDEVFLAAAYRSTAAARELVGLRRDLGFYGPYEECGVRRAPRRRERLIEAGPATGFAARQPSRG